MTKQELIDAVAAVVGSKTKARDAVHSLMNAIAFALSRGERVIIPGFGTFRPVRRASRVCRVPGTGQEVTVKSRIVPKFVASRKLKATVE